MDEIFQKILNSELLSEETKGELSEELDKFKTQLRAEILAKELVEERKTLEKTIREELEADVRAELAEQWQNQKNILIESMDQYLSDRVDSEFQELKEDIARFRDLEVEHAAQIIEEKQALRQKLDEELETLVEQLDSFLEARLDIEFEELREDLVVAKENMYGRKVFEAIVAEYAANFVDEKSIQTQLRLEQKQTAELNAKLVEAEQKHQELIRENKMNQVLAPLSGKKREQMEFILRGVEVSKLEETYTRFISRVLREDVEKNVQEAQVDVNKSNVEFISGDNEPTKPVVTEGVEKTAPVQPQRSKLNDLILAEARAIAGLKPRK